MALERRLIVYRNGRSPRIPPPPGYHGGVLLRSVNPTDGSLVREYAEAHGMRVLREDGVRWVVAGETSIEEILRVTRESA